MEVFSFYFNDSQTLAQRAEVGEAIKLDSSCEKPYGVTARFELNLTSITELDESERKIDRVVSCFNITDHD